MEVWPACSELIFQVKQQSPLLDRGRQPDDPAQIFTGFLGFPVEFRKGPVHGGLELLPGRTF